MPKNNSISKGNKPKKGQASGSGSSTSKVPRATIEQRNLALLLDKKNDDDYEIKLQQIQECTACTMEDAIAAMHDADNNVRLAIENLLDQKSENDDWQDTVTKKCRSRKQNELKPTASLSSPNNTELIFPQNDESRSLTDLPSQKAQNITSTKRNFARPQAVPHLANGLTSDSLLPEMASTQPDIERDGNWDFDCCEWRGEAIEVVNSASNLTVNIHADSELLRLVTCDSEDPKETTSDVEEKTVELEPPKATCGVAAEDKSTDVPQQSKPLKGSVESVESIKARLFSTYARSAAPPLSHIPKDPVFFAPGSRNSVVNPSAQTLERGVTQTQNASPSHQLELPCAKPPQNLESLKSDQHPERKPRTKNQLADASNRLKAQNQCFSPVMNNLLHPVSKLEQDLQTDHPYQSVIQSNSSLKEAYAKLQDPESPPNCPTNQAPNNFENPNAYEYNLLGELSQNMKQVGLEPQSGKSDAFTQSLSSNQPEVIMPPSYHSMQPAKPVVSQPPQINKPIPTMPPSANQQPLSATQPQLHHAIHPGLPQLLSQFQTAFPMYNLPSGSGTAAPHLFDLDQLQALQQQQRILFELQQSQQQPQPQSVANEPNLPNTCADVLPSSKSSVPMHHVTTPNVGHGFTFLPYHGMVFMNGYPNAFLNQQQTSQNSGSPSQSSGHGGSPLTQHQSSQPQYAKAMSAAQNYAAYQGIRQTNFEEIGDMFYSSLTKPIGFKHGSSGNTQGMYGVPTQPVSKAGGTDLLLTSKLQQQTSALQTAQPTSQPQAAATPNTQPQTQSQFSLYQLQYMANAAVAASVQNQHQSQTVASSGMAGPGGMVPMHARPQH